MKPVIVRRVGLQIAGIPGLICPGLIEASAAWRVSFHALRVFPG